MRPNAPRFSRSRISFGLIFSVTLVMAACATGGPRGRAAATGRLASRIDSIIATAPVDQVQWGIFAIDFATGEILYEHQPNTKFIPASNQKLLTAAAALNWLGPEFRYPTALVGTGRITTIPSLATPTPTQPNALAGDLVLIPSGDPTIGGPLETGATLSLTNIASALRASGIERVLGTLVVDASAWDSATAVASWMVEDLADAATGGPFALNEGGTIVRIRAADAPGGAAQVTWSPFGEDTFIQARIETVAAGTDPRPASARITASYLPESRRIVLQGRIPAGTTDSLRVGTRDPVRQAAATLARTLRDQGVTIDGGWRVSWNAGERLFGELDCTTGPSLPFCARPVEGDTRPMSLRSSPPLMEIVEAMLEPSNNWIAEQMVRSLGAVPLGPPTGIGSGIQAPSRPRAGWPSGLDAVRRYLIDVAGVDSLSFQLRDGSGLSAQNVVTPVAIVRVLDHMASAPWGRTFRDALPEPGEAGSTLSARLEGLAGRVYGKTGSLTNVATLSGYLIRPNGGTVVFSIMTNGSGLPGATVRAAIDQVVRELAR